MGGTERELPFFFMKPADSLFQSSTVRYPRNTSELSYEAELVVVIGDKDDVFGYALGIDLTKRDIQKEAKQMSRPWESSKSFDFSALIGEIVPADQLEAKIQQAKLQLSLDGHVKQSATIDQMIWSIPELLQQLREQDFSVKQGDVIFTGTPAGVGPLHIGHECEVTLTHEGSNLLPPLKFTVA